MQASHLQEPAGHCTNVKARVVDHPSLVRDGVAIVNTDKRGYQEALARRHALVAKEERMVTLETNVASLSGELAEIKEMLKCLSIAAKTS